MPANLFITNDASGKLSDRLRELIGASREMRALVGFFYFSGIKVLYDALRANRIGQLAQRLFRKILARLKRARANAVQRHALNALRPRSGGGSVRTDGRLGSGGGRLPGGRNPAQQRVQAAT